MNLSLEGGEVVGLYLLLRANRPRLDRTMESLCQRMEKQLYDELTIAEFENLEGVYARMAGRPEGKR